MTTPDNTLFEKALAAFKRSYSPYSQFPVGACLKTTSGNYYSGCNIENASYSLTLCAEATAISQMINESVQHIAEILVIGNGQALCTPCGACRQRIREFANEDTRIYIADAHGHRATFTLGELLPYSFGPHNLEHIL